MILFARKKILMLCGAERVWPTSGSERSGDRRARRSQTARAWPRAAQQFLAKLFSNDIIMLVVFRSIFMQKSTNKKYSINEILRKPERSKNGTKVTQFNGGEKCKDQNIDELYYKRDEELELSNLKLKKHSAIQLEKLEKNVWASNSIISGANRMQQEMNEMKHLPRQRTYGLKSGEIDGFGK